MRPQYCPLCGAIIRKRTGSLLICECGWNSKKYQQKVFNLINKKCHRVCDSAEVPIGEC